MYAPALNLDDDDMFTERVKALGFKKTLNFIAMINRILHELSMIMVDREDYTRRSLDQEDINAIIRKVLEVYPGMKQPFETDPRRVLEELNVLAPMSGCFTNNPLGQQNREFFDTFMRLSREVYSNTSMLDRPASRERRSSSLSSANTTASGDTSVSIEPVTAPCARTNTTASGDTSAMRKPHFSSFKGVAATAGAIIGGVVLMALAPKIILGAAAVGAVLLVAALAMAVGSKIKSLVAPSSSSRAENSYRTASTISPPPSPKTRQIGYSP